MVALPTLSAVTLPPSTEATAASELTQRTFLFVALGGDTTAVSVALSPSVSESSVLDRLTFSTLTTLDLTVTWQLAVKPPSSVVTVTVVLPGLNAITRPFTAEATVSSELDHRTFLFVALDGDTVAVRTSLLPTVSVRSFLSSRTLSTLTTLDLTVTRQLAVRTPSCVVTVTVALPTLSAVTFPFTTETTDVLVLVQRTFLSVALDGNTVAVSVALSPTVSARSFLSRLTLSTLTALELTVT